MLSLNFKSNHSDYGKILPVVFIIAGLLLPLSLLFFDIPQRDEAYQMLATLDYQHSPLAPLAYFNGHLWMLLFGDNVLSLRILNLLCHAVAIAIGCFIFFRHTGNRTISAALFMMLCSGSQVWAMHIYNWDTGCYPFAMLCLAAAMTYWRKPSVKHLAFLGLMSAGFTLSRLPSGVIIPALCVMIGCRLKSQPKHAVAGIVVYLATLVTASLLLLLLIFGGCPGIEEAFRPENIITGHGLSDVSRYIERVRVITPTLIIQSAVAVMWIIYAWVMLYLRRHRIFWLSLMAISLLATICFFYWLLPTRTSYGLMFLPLIGAWLYPMLSKLRVSGRFGKPTAEGWILLIFCIAPIIGSDGFQERFMLLPVLPVVLTFCYPQLRKYIRWFICFSFFTAVGMIGVKEAYYITSGLSKANNIPRLNYILVDEQSASELHEQTLVIDSLRTAGKRIATDGMMHYESSLFHDIPLLRGLHEFHIGDYDKEIPEISRNIKGYDALLISYPMFFMPGADNTEPNPEADRQFDQLLKNSGFTRTDLTSGRFVIYTR